MGGLTDESKRSRRAATTAANKALIYNERENETRTRSRKRVNAAVAGVLFGEGLLAHLARRLDVDERSTGDH